MVWVTGKLSGRRNVQGKCPTLLLPVIIRGYGELRGGFYSTDLNFTCPPSPSIKPTSLYARIFLRPVLVADAWSICICAWVTFGHSLMVLVGDLATPVWHLSFVVPRVEINVASELAANCSSLSLAGHYTTMHRATRHLNFLPKMWSNVVDPLTQRFSVYIQL